MASKKVMQKEQVALIAVVLLVAIGFLLMQHTASPRPTEERRATFQCQDGTSFTAVFMSNDELTVLRAGAAASVAIKQDLNRVQYDNETHSYIFDGSTAITANKEARTLVQCTQVNS